MLPPLLELKPCLLLLKPAFALHNLHIFHIQLEKVRTNHTGSASLPRRQKVHCGLPIGIFVDGSDDCYESVYC